MIKTQYPYVDEQGTEFPNLIRTYSDEGKIIIQVETGHEYEEAVDTYPCKYTYIEKEDPDPEPEPEPNEPVEE
ncbi:MAG: hypothetical protein IKU30_04910 [Clostridia bacterium]|nr:hypothetical protein [Clostridia bacterium]